MDEIDEVKELQELIETLLDYSTEFMTKVHESHLSKADKEDIYAVMRSNTNDVANFLRLIEFKAFSKKV